MRQGLNLSPNSHLTAGSEGAKQSSFELSKPHLGMRNQRNSLSDRLGATYFTLAYAPQS